MVHWALCDTHYPTAPQSPLAAALLPLTQPSRRLQAVQEEAAELFAQLRSKMVAVPRGQQQQQQRQLQEGQAGGGQADKRRKSVTFQQRAVSAA